MIALDTNVLIRYLISDDKKQAGQAKALVKSQCTESNPAFISLVVLCETIWVLEDVFHYKKADIVPILKTVLCSKELILEQHAIALTALDDYQDGKADFADYLIARVAADHNAQPLYTFDRKAAEHPLIELVS